MILHETTGEPQMISLNGLPPKNLKLRLATHKLDDEQSVIDFHDEMSKGRDILVQVQHADATYIITREFIESKISIGAAIQEPKL